MVDAQRTNAPEVEAPCEPPPEITDPHRKSVDRMGTSVDILAAMLGRSTLELKGFDGKMEMPSWARPGLRMVSPQVTMVELSDDARRKKALMRGILIATIVLTHLGVGAGSALLAIESTASDRARVALAWRVVDVLPTGVTVRLGTSNSQALTQINVGALLPSGARLKSTNPATRSFETDQGSTTLTTSP